MNSEKKQLTEVLLAVQKPRKGSAKFQLVEKAAKQICQADPPEHPDGLDMIARTLQSNQYLRGIVGHIATQAIEMEQLDWVEFFAKHRPQLLVERALYSGRMAEFRQILDSMADKEVLKIVKANVKIVLTTNDQACAGYRGRMLLNWLLADHPWTGKHISEKQGSKIVKSLLEVYGANHDWVVGIKRGLLSHHAHNKENRTQTPGGQRPKI